MAGLFGLRGVLLVSSQLATASTIGFGDKKPPPLRDVILARPGNTYEKLKRDSNKRLKAEEKRESKRVRKTTKQSGGPTTPADDPKLTDEDCALS
jgi:hypothetical protein